MAIYNKRPGEEPFFSEAFGGMDGGGDWSFIHIGASPYAKIWASYRGIIGLRHALQGLYNKAQGLAPGNKSDVPA